MKESNATSHDSHYNKADHRFGREAISIMEAIACTGIPEEFWPLCKRNLNLALGFKYEARLGEKDDPNKEMDKAANFRYRARHGFWPWNEVKEFHGVKDHEPVKFGPPPAHLLKTETPPIMPLDVREGWEARLKELNRILSHQKSPIITLSSLARERTEITERLAQDDARRKYQEGYPVP